MDRRVEHIMRQRNRRALGDIVTREEREFHPVAPLGHPVAHSRHPTSDLGCCPIAARGMANEFRKPLKRRMG